MTLAAGTKLGPYEILAPLGAGGMGEVYRGKDTRLGRDVAIKVLPEDFFDDKERVERFEREAKLLAALNHPNIAAIYSFEEISGSSGSSASSVRHILVMELVEGEDLGQRLASGALPLEESLSLARQIAEGLEAAHEKGIIHRDLKPANVKVTPEGRVKLLDFGLAKIFGGDGGPGSSPSITHSPTLTARATAAGMILGTAAYMSPEQARGKAVDKRTDIWGFGCVLYEMLTGKRAFEGETVSDTLVSVLSKDPDWAALPPPTPTKIRDLLRKCLRRDARARLHDIADARLDLEELGASPNASGSLPFEEKTALPNPTVAIAERASRERGSKSLLYLSWAIAAAFAAAAVSLALRTPRRDEPARIRKLTFSGRDSQPSASPDGSMVAFTSSRDGTSRIWIKQIAGGGEARLTSGPDRLARFSPDGSSILFLRDLGSSQAVYRISLVGGEPRKLLDNALEADWSPDGKKIAFVRMRREAEGRKGVLGIAEVDGGRESSLLEIKDSDLFNPRWSPSGDAIAVLRGDSIGNTTNWALLRVDVATGKTRPIGRPDVKNPAFGPTWLGSGGSLAFVRSESVVAGYSAAPGRVVSCDIDAGTERTLFWTPGLVPLSGAGFEFAPLDVLGAGRLLFDETERQQNLREVPLDKSSAIRDSRALTKGSSLDRQPTYSADGKRVLFSSNRSGNLDLWLVELATGAVTQLTDDAAQDWDPGFTPDGRRIVWSSDRSGVLEIWIANADGSGARQLTKDGVDAENPTASSDGWVVYSSANPDRPGIWKIREDGSQAARLAAGNFNQPEVSPDGRYAAYIQLDSANLRDTIHVVEIASGRNVPFEVDVPYRLGSANISWGRTRWMPGGQAIAYIGSDAAGLSGVYVQNFAPGRDTSASRRAVAGFSPEFVTESLGVSRDGSRIAISALSHSASIMLAEDVPGIVAPLRKSAVR